MANCSKFWECLNNLNLTALHDFLSHENFEFCPHQNAFTPDEFNSYYRNKSFSLNSFSCIHINCRSLLHNFDNIVYAFLDELKLKPTVICLSETWFQEDTVHPLCQLQGYKFEGTSREERRGGGVGIFIKENVQYVRRFDLEINSEVIESCFIEIINCNNKVLVGSIYRPPDQPVDDFLLNLTNIFNIVNTEKKKLYLLGDYNINWAATRQKGP